MIITRTPLRISFAGGGSDLPAFYHKMPGAVLSTTIDKYIYLTIHPYFYKNGSLIKYTETENVDSPRKIKHTIFKSILSELKLNGVEISSIGDIPGQTGMGSSSSLAIGIHHSVSAYLKRPITKKYLAEAACRTEIEKLRKPIGKQDQYAAAFGGFNFIRFLPNNKVIVEPVKISANTKRLLKSRLLLFYTGEIRPAERILKEQTRNITSSKKRFANLAQMVKYASVMRHQLEQGDLDAFGKYLDKCWTLKKSLADSISNPHIDHYYSLAMANGALGGKVLGAGGGGFLLFYCPKRYQQTLVKSLKDLRLFGFNFSEEGSRIIFRNDIS